MKKVYFTLLFLLHTLQAEMSMEEKKRVLEEKLFAKVFTKKPQSKAFYLPLTVNDILQDEVFVKIDNKENILINQETIDYIISLLKEEYQKKTPFQIEKNGFLALESLDTLGITASYDSKNIALNITIPIERKRASLIQLTQYSKEDINGSVQAENYSGGINFYLNQQYNQYNDKSFEKSALNFSSDFHLNMHNVVLEGDFSYSQAYQKLTRGAFKLTTHDTTNNLRYKIGDISLPSHKRMSYQNAFGIGVEKVFNINQTQKQKSTRINAHEFFIEKNSKVEIYVNNRYRNSLNLLAGTHQLFDLNLPTGLNHIKLKIIQKGGKIEQIEFDDFSFSEILKKGLLRYGIGVGVESSEYEGDWVYNKEKQITSSYMEYGLFNDITVKSGVQTNDNYKTASLELLIGTNFGLFNPYTIASKTSNIMGYKQGLEYQSNIGDVRLNFNYEKIDKNYSTTDNRQHKPRTTYKGNLYSQIGMGINMGINASYEKEHEEEKKQYGIVFRKNFSQLSSELNLNRIERYGEKSNTQIYATVEYRFGQYSARYINNMEHQQQVNLIHGSGKRHGLNSDILLGSNKQSKDYSLRADFNNEKFRMDTNYNFNDNINGKNQNIGLQLGTGVVFAGNRYSITTPISSSFIIVDNDDRLKQPLGIKNYQEVDEFVYDTFAVNISDYEHRELVIEESLLDFGIDLKYVNKEFMSNYKSGLVMDIVVQNFYSLKGVFYEKESKKPLAKKAFKIFNRQTGEKSVSFTDEKGAFIINHIDAGVYNISFTQEPQYNGVARYTFNIEEKQNSHLMDMGNIYIKMPEKAELKKHLIYK